ncbi:polysaccharide deacetylase family protein [Asticcacaulis sp. AC402]|uniref:polysaccharide deacetylase family protein n=1 Tax=Asticcacaulis sp. AC402 TaxID=1282361 RepID=UPI0004150438|nr:polysaccharide deacetylase family protein [Asticcacaulis sp. AC402]
MTFSRLLAASAALMVMACGPALAGDKPKFQVSITVDDLTVHGALPPGTTRQQVGDNFLNAFKVHGVKEAWGFINGKSLIEDPSTETVLASWRAAGHPLGNHGFTHMSASQNTVAAFKGDIEGNEPILKSYMGDADWHWLRFPFLNAGSDAGHGEIMQFVKDTGYRIADVTITFNDWAYTDAYARCAARGDTAAVASLREKYMSDVVASVKRARGLSQKIYGRDIPHVLLIHVGAFTGEMLPEVLTAFDAEGAEYVTLEQAQSDPAYDFTGPKAAQGTMLERVAQEKGIKIDDGSIASLNDVGPIMGMCQ